MATTSFEPEKEMEKVFFEKDFHPHHGKGHRVGGSERKKILSDKSGQKSAFIHFPLLHCRFLLPILISNPFLSLSPFRSTFLLSHHHRRIEEEKKRWKGKEKSFFPSKSLSKSEKLAEKKSTPPSSFRS